MYMRYFFFFFSFLFITTCKLYTYFSSVVRLRQFFAKSSLFYFTRFVIVIEREVTSGWLRCGSTNDTQLYALKIIQLSMHNDSQLIFKRHNVRFIIPYIYIYIYICPLLNLNRRSIRYIWTFFFFYSLTQSLTYKFFAYQ